MRELFPWQLAGDVVKIASWLLSYIMLAKAMTRLFIITELISGVVFAGLAVLCVDEYGLTGVSMAYLLTYIFYGLAMVFYIGRWLDLFRIKSKSSVE